MVMVNGHLGEAEEGFRSGICGVLTISAGIIYDSGRRLDRIGRIVEGESQNKDS